MKKEPIENEKWWQTSFEKKHYGSMFKCGDYEALLKDVSSIVAESRKRCLEEVKEEEDWRQELKDWCDIQFKRWGSDLDNGKNHNCFRDGVRSGYAWMKDHADHIGIEEKCDCPRL